MALFEKQELSNVQANHCTIIQAGGDITIDQELYQKLIASQQNPRLFHRLIKEKIELCKKHIQNKNVGELKKTTDTIFNYGLNGIDEELKQTLYHYRFLLAVFEKNDNSMDDCVDNLQGKCLEEAEILLKFQKEPYEISFSAYCNLSPETQSVLLDCLFEKERYTNIENLYQAYVKEEKDVTDFLKYYYGLSAFNLRQFEEAYHIWGQVAKGEKRARIHLLQTLSLAQIEIIKFGKEGTNQEELEQIFHELEDIREEDVNAFVGCQQIMALTKLQMAIWLAPNRFMEILESYEIKIQKNPDIQFLLGCFYESCNEWEKAVDIYHNIDWKNNGNFLFRLLLSNLILGKYDEVIQIYESANEISKTIPCMGIWLSALKQQNVTEYYHVIEEKAETYKDNVEELFYLLLSTDNDKELFDKLFLSKIEDKIETIKGLDFRLKINYAGILLRFEYAELCLELLNSVESAVSLEEKIVFDFYESLCTYKSAEIQANKTSFPIGKIASYLENKVKICDWFIKNHIKIEWFLKEKLNCLFLQKKTISMLSCTKQLYEITHEEDVAVNMVALLLESETSSKSDYEYCIQALKNTTRPKGLIALAVAYKRIDKIKEANFCLYKAIFLLNGEDDFEIYNGFFQLQNEMIYAHHHLIVDFDEVVGNTVVTLRAVPQQEDTKDTDLIEYVCLDSESELEEMVSDNISMGARHFCSKDPKYLRLQNKKKGQSIWMDGKEFVIEEILNRDVYAYRYVFHKCIQNPDKCNVIAGTVKGNSIEDFWVQVKEMTHQYQGARKKTTDGGGERDVFLDSYHFKQNALGLPIDTLTQKDYDNYIDVIRMLLYGKNQALYAGTVAIDKITKHKMVLTLSSLVIMCQMGQLDLLKSLESQIVIPVSLTEFLNVRVKKSIEMQVISPGKLIEMPDGSPAMLSFDETVVDMWNAIYEICLGFENVEITNQERLEFDVMEEISSELLFSSFKIAPMQMDCMILAKQMDAVYLCDDLFFRKMATAAGIKNTNFTSLILSLDDEQKAAEICMELSKTNYMYVPDLKGDM